MGTSTETGVADGVVASTARPQPETTKLAKRKGTASKRQCLSGLIIRPETSSPGRASLRCRDATEAASAPASDMACVQGSAPMTWNERRTWSSASRSASRVACTPMKTMNAVGSSFGTAVKTTSNGPLESPQPKKMSYWPR